MHGDVPELLLELRDDEEDRHEEDRHEEDTVETFTPGVSTIPARTDSTVPYEFQQRRASATEIVLTDAPPVVQAAQAITTLRAPATLPWYVRLLHKIAAGLASLTSMNT